MFPDYLYVVQEAVMSAADSPKGMFGGMMPLIMMMMVVMYFLVIRPQKKKDKERRDLMDGLSKGNRIVTTGGIHGKIVGLDDDTITLQISDEPTIKIKMVRASIAFVVPKDEPKEDKDKK